MSLFCSKMFSDSLLLTTIHLLARSSRNHLTFLSFTTSIFCTIYIYIFQLHRITSSPPHTLYSGNASGFLFMLFQILGMWVEIMVNVDSKDLNSNPTCTLYLCDLRQATQLSGPWFYYKLKVSNQVALKVDFSSFGFLPHSWTLTHSLRLDVKADSSSEHIPLQAQEPGRASLVYIIYYRDCCMYFFCPSHQKGDSVQQVTKEHLLHWIKNDAKLKSPNLESVRSKRLKGANSSFYKWRNWKESVWSHILVISRTETGTQVGDIQSL